MSATWTSACRDPLRLVLAGVRYDRGDNRLSDISLVVLIDGTIPRDMAMDTVVDQPAQQSVPRWISSAFSSKPGRDPLGLQSITTDRMMPVLVPGILALSRRARYFSFYPFLIDELATKNRSATQAELSDFIKHREFELSLAVDLCERCGSSATGAVGSSRSGPRVHSRAKEFDRQESVESYLGGYGLYYRSPMRELGVIAPKGEVVIEMGEPLPRDVLRPGRSIELAEAFREAIKETRYYQEYFWGSQPIPRDVLEEYSQHGCLCRLGDVPEEQALIRDTLLEMPAETPSLDPGYLQQVEERRRSFALLMWILGGEVGDEPAIGRLEEHFRRAVWQQDIEHLEQQTARARTFAQWSAVAARDHMESSLVAIFHDVCDRGLAVQPADGMSEEELDDFLRNIVLSIESIEISGKKFAPASAMATSEYVARLRESVSALDLVGLRTELTRQGSALAGLTLLLILNDRLSDAITDRSSWRGVAAQSSNWQPGLLGLLRELRLHLGNEPRMGETLTFVARRFVIAVHERNAFSKLPDFTFRFRWETSRLRFYADHAWYKSTNLPDIRVSAVSSLGVDLGLLAMVDGALTLTPEGDAFQKQVLG